MPALDVITIVTTDLDRSLAFARLLGIGPPDLVGPGFATVDVAHPIRLAWTVEPHSSPRGVDHVRLGVRCVDADELAQRYRAATGAGHRAFSPPHDAAWGATVCRLLDPDGNVVELYAPLP